MNKFAIVSLIFITGFSCSQPKNDSDISRIYEALAEQKHFYYNVEYSVNEPKNEKLNRSIFGSVALNKSARSGISTAYFGLKEQHLPNYLKSIYLNNEWIYHLSSSTFDQTAIDLVRDSLHSPLLINPQILFQLEANSTHVNQIKINQQCTEWHFNLKHKNAQLILLWDEDLKKIISLEYRHLVNSDENYSRKWIFKYISQYEFERLAKGYKLQNQRIKQDFL